MKHSFKKMLLPLLATSLMSNVVMASDCYILIHGHGINGTSMVDDNGQPKQHALDYWLEADEAVANVDGRQAGDYIEDLRGNGHYGIVGYDATDGSGAYWGPALAGTVAQQISQITSGQHDNFVHGNQCNSTDDFYIVAHSQGAQVVTYIAGNTDINDPFQNEVIDTDITQAGLNNSDYHCDDGIVDEFDTCYYENVQVTNLANAFNGAATQTALFDVAMAPITAIFTVSGAINGTEGTDRLCNGTWLDDQLAELLFTGRQCEDVLSLQTLEIYNPSTYTGQSLSVPIYHLGGIGAFPLYLSLSSTKLNGDDDGYVNLASQMNCAGSAKRQLQATLKEYRWGSTYFTCDNNNKRHFNSYNLLLTDDDHDSSKNGALSVFHYDVVDMPSCGGYWGGMGSAINDCVGEIY